MDTHQTTTRTPNQLIHEKSPYLQQHAYNPVNWYPWGEEAFARARKENKPIFLSIGYSTCHWCHVMERESFENEETAKLMNELFINIKVDREERPDVDQVYMIAVQAISGSGGWPLSAWLTPELKPFYAGTYFPPRPMHGRPSFTDALRSLHDAWVNEPEKVARTANAIHRAIQKHSVVSDADLVATPKEDKEQYYTLADTCFLQLQRSYHPAYGGFSTAPKFPRPVTIEFLLRYYTWTGNNDALNMALHTLQKMAEGGMYDQLGGGFARYSVDSEWKVPHFEKMLYDQGQLLGVYADAYTLCGNPFFATTIQQTVEYLTRDLMNPDGLFYSAEDADSEGEEGTFYVWKKEELQRLLSEDEYRVVECYYGITDAGNFEHANNVLHTSKNVAETSKETGLPETAITPLLASAHTKLFTARTQRVRPHRDEKILASWNGLAISGLARAANALGEPEYVTIARTAADRLLDTMLVNGVLMHRMKDGEVRYPGYLEDYAFVAAGLLDLYEATFDAKYLRQAELLVQKADKLFWDEEGGGYFMTSGEDASVLVRSKGDHDGAEPAGNSVMAMNLLRFGNLFHDDILLARAERTIRLFTSRIAEYPVTMPLLAAAARALEEPPRQIVVAAGETEDETNTLLQQIRKAYLPDTALIMVNPGGVYSWLAERIPLLADMHPLDGHAAVYVCENFVCKRPATSFNAEEH